MSRSRRRGAGSPGSPTRSDSRLEAEPPALAQVTESLDNSEALLEVAALGFEGMGAAVGGADAEYWFGAGEIGMRYLDMAARAERRGTAAWESLQSGEPDWAEFVQPEVRAHEAHAAAASTDLVNRFDEGAAASRVGALGSAEIDSVEEAASWGSHVFVGLTPMMSRLAMLEADPSFPAGLAAFDKLYGREWLYLYDALMELDPPYLLQMALASTKGAAEYEAELQARGEFTLDLVKIDTIAQTIFVAANQHFEDEMDIVESLQNLTRRDLAVLEERYALRFGTSLDEVLNKALDSEGESRQAADAWRTGDPVLGVIAHAEDLVDDSRIDTPKQLVALFKAVPPGQRARLAERVATDPKVADLRDRAVVAAERCDEEWDEPWRHSGEVVRALFDGNVARAEALMIRGRIQRDDLDDRMDVGDKEAKHDREVLEQLEASEDLEAMQAAYAELGEERSLDHSLALMDKGMGNAATSLLRGDQIGYRAAKLHAAFEGVYEESGEEDRVIRELLRDPEYGNEDPQSKRRQAARQQALDSRLASWNKGGVEERLGKHYDGVYTEWFDLNQMPLEAKGEKLDREHAMLVFEGHDEDWMIAWKALYTFNGDYDMLLGVLQGKSKAQMAQLEARFTAFTRRDLEDMIRDEFSGDEAFELLQARLGAPETVREAYSRADVRHGHYREEEGSRGEYLMAFFVGPGLAQQGLDPVERMLMGSEHGAEYDRQYQQFAGMFEEGEYGKLEEAEQADVAMDRYRWLEQQSTTWRDARDELGDAIATGAEIAIATVSTLLSAGSAAPWLAAAIGTAMRAAANGGAKGAGHIAGDALRKAITVAIAGQFAAAARSGGALASQMDDLVALVGRKGAVRILGDAAKAAVGTFGIGAVAGSMAALQYQTSPETWDIIEAAMRSAGIKAAGSVAGDVAVKASGHMGAGEVVGEVVEGGLDAIRNTPNGDAALAMFALDRLAGLAKAGVGGMQKQRSTAEAAEWETRRQGAAFEAEAPGVLANVAFEEATAQALGTLNRDRLRAFLRTRYGDRYRWADIPAARVLEALTYAYDDELP